MKINKRVFYILSSLLILCYSVLSPFYKVSALEKKDDLPAFNEVKNITGPDFEWGFFAYPEVKNGVNGTEAMVIGGQSFAITSKCKNVEAAFGFIEKMTRGEFDEKLAKESISLPADAENHSWPEQLADVKPYFDNCKEIMGGAESNPDITPALKENLQKLYAGKLTAKEFVANMKSAAK